MRPFIVSGSKLNDVLNRVREWEAKGYECVHQIAKIERTFKYYKRDMTTYSGKYFKKRKFVCSDSETKYIVKMRLIESEVNK